MDFHARAQNALQRGSPARAMILLVQGLRRSPEREDALDLLLLIYTTQILKPGLESDLLKALGPQQNAPALLRFVLDELTGFEKVEMARALKLRAREEGFEIAPPIAPLSKPETEQGEISAEDEEKTPVLPDQSSEAEALEDEESALPGESAEAEGVHLSSPDDRESSAGDRKAAKKKASRPVKKRGKSQRVLALILVFFFVGALSGTAILGWQQARESSRIAALDVVMSEFDPLNPGHIFSQIEQFSISPGGREDAHLFERRQFIKALIELEGGPGEYGEMEPIVGEAQTAWGAAAMALMAAREKRWEEAMRFVHFLDQAYGDTLPAFFAHGRICEARRDWECAQARYSRIQQHFDGFLPARMGAMRVAAYRFDEQGWEQQQEALGRRKNAHPYANLPWIDPFRGKSESWSEEIGGAEEDRFHAAWSKLAEAQRELADGQWDQAQAACQSGSQESEMLLPAGQVLCGVAAALRGDVRGSRDYFMAAAAPEDLTRSFYRRLQAMAPAVLSDLGRADWALAFTIPLRVSEELDSTGAGRGFVSNREAARPAHFLPPRAESDELSSGRAAQALFIRGKVLLALGALSESRATAKVLGRYSGYGAKARYLQARASIIAGDLNRAEGEVLRIDDEQLRAQAQARIQILRGQGSEGLSILESVTSPTAESLRLATLANLADGRGREALRLLDSAPDSLEFLALRPLRLRALARTGQEFEFGEDQVAKALESATVEYLIDLGAAALWRRDFPAAKELLERALMLAPGYGEANWLMGLVMRVEGDQRLARQYFQRGIRGDEDSATLLIELGQVLLDRGDVERAREVFLRVTLREKQNIEAVAGLGRSYYLGDQIRGQRDLLEVLGKYNATDRNAAARAEIYRWLAILHGIRQGADEGYPYLIRAKEIIGERAELLVEEGRYFEARGEWEEARKAFSRALQVNPTIAEPHLGLARVAEEEGELEAARGHLRRAASLAADDQWRQEAEERLAALKEKEQGE